MKKEVIRKRMFAFLLGIFVLFTGGASDGNNTDTNMQPGNKVKMFFLVNGKNAAVTLYLNGEEISWTTKQTSMQTPNDVSVIQYSVAVPVNESENVVGIQARATGDNPGIRIEVSRAETDTRWKGGTPKNRDWLELKYDDTSWPVITPELQGYHWSSQDHINNPGYYMWGKDGSSPEVCFRQVIRGTEKTDQDVRYKVYDWGKVLEGLGYHRAIIRVPESSGKTERLIKSLSSSGKASAAWAHVAWRRRDSDPEQKAIFIHDAKTGKRIENFEIINLNREYLDVVFEPQTIPGDYEIYYLPYFERFGRWHYWASNEKYVRPYNLCDENWLSKVSYYVGNPDATNPKISEGNWQRLPRAELVEIQSRTEFDSFYPMEVPANKEEIQEIATKHKEKDFLVFPEDRKYPVRMFETIPLRWVKTVAGNEFIGEAQPGEYYCFQIGVYALKKEIRDIAVRYSGLKNEKGAKIMADAFHCINTEGVDWLGKPFDKTFSLLKGKVRPLWIGFQVPDQAKGNYTGTVTVTPEGMEPVTVKVELNVSGSIIKDKGDDEPWRHSRLRWLDSPLGINDDELVPPYTPLKISGNRVECLNRSVLFGVAGMPQKIVSNGRDVIASPMKFNVMVNGTPVVWEQQNTDKIIYKKPAKIVRLALARGGGIQLENTTTMEADGMVRFDVTLTSNESIPIDAITAEVPYNADVARYMTGEDKRIGDFRSGTIDWPISTDFKLWLGDWNAGMQVNFSDKTKGHVTEDNGMVILKAETDKLVIEKDRKLTFSFRLFVTPFKPINNKIHWSTRTSVVRTKGDTDYSVNHEKDYSWATVLHCHHGIPQNPWINYPFMTSDTLATIQKSVINRGGIGVQLYYTTRELTNRTVELWALRSLGTEIFPGIDVFNEPDFPTNTTGHPWLREHLINGFNKAWPAPLGPGLNDQAISNLKLSRWHNYYIEGLNWLIRKRCLASLYIDGIGYNREIMKRVARSLSRINPEYRIEFHQQCGKGDTPGSPLNRQMEHIPYFTKLWFGESFNYNRSPDYWLVEVSGIPFGITGEMLDDTGTANSWRGMIYGLNGRFLEETPVIYKLWDDFGIQDSEWLGYWNPECPVKTGRNDIKATVYRKDGKSMICLASWAEEDVDTDIAVEWKALGLDPSKITLTAPEIKGMQTPQSFRAGDRLPVKKAQGLILIAEEIDK